MKKRVGSLYENYYFITFPVHFDFPAFFTYTIIKNIPFYRNQYNGIAIHDVKKLSFWWKHFFLGSCTLKPQKWRGSKQARWTNRTEKKLGVGKSIEKFFISSRESSFSFGASKFCSVCYSTHTFFTLTLACLFYRILNHF